MEDKTILILSKVNDLIKLLQSYRDFVTDLNPCASSDHLLEECFEEMNEIKEIHESQFER